jgi:putative ABC transport system permease protein
MPVYRLLLRLFPPAFRRRFGDDMADLFADSRRRARREGAGAVARLWIHTVGDVARHALAERRHARHTSPVSGGPVWRSILQDVRHTGRGWRHRPGLTAVALLTLGLGIGANTAIFSVVDAFFVRPLPYPDAGHLVGLYSTNTHYPSDRSVETAADVQYWRDHATSLRALAAMSGGTVTLTGRGDPTPLRFVTTMPEFFEVVGVQPAMGRPFTAAEARADEHVVVISHGLWVDRFGATPTILGQPVRLGSVTWRVIGVMPAPFALPADVDLWMPFDLARALPDAWYLSAVGRLKPDVTVDDAQQDFDHMAAALAAGAPKTRKNRGFQVIRLRDDLAWGLAGGLTLLQAVVGVILLIACANVANLLLAQAVVRQREFGVRVALGATAGRLIRQLLTESLVLASGGALLGLAFAAWGVGLLASLAPPTVLRRSVDLRIDGPVLAFSVGLTVVTSLVFGLAPALLAVRSSRTAPLGHGGRSTAGLTWARHQRLRASLVVAETALAVVLLTGGGLLVRSFGQLMAQTPRLRTDHLLTALISLPAARYETATSRQQFFATLVGRLQAVAGARQVVASNGLPYSNWEWQSAFLVRGRTGHVASAGIREVSGGDYFEALGIPLLKGRSFAPTDDAAAPAVVVVSDVFAAQFLSGADPLGQAISLDRGKTWRTVVGLVAATRNLGLDEDLRAEMYIPLVQDLAPPATMLIAVRTTADPVGFGPPLRATVASIDPDLPVQALKTMDQLIGQTVADRRFFMTLLACFAGLAALLAATGLYGVMSFLVGQARRDIGIRIALGARPAQVQRALLAKALAVVGVGLGLGLLGAWWLASLLASQLFRVTAHDPVTLVSVSGLLLVAAVVACWLPSRRSLHVDPAIVLRVE